MKYYKAALITVLCLIIIPGCASTKKIAFMDIEPGEKIELKYPIVLVHGIARNDNLERYRPWSGIPNVLQGCGVEVYFGNTDAWGTIASNADMLKLSIDNIMEETGCEKVNIIAHSKGGIDSRYCIWKHGYGDKVASLTTISTPHYGSEIADLFYNAKIIHTRIIKRRLHIIGKLYGDENPDIYNVNYELTSENMREFSEFITADSKVFYQSIYTIMDNPRDDPMFAYSYIYVRNQSGENDGIVSEKSAHWGENSVRLPGSISHEQIIGHGRKKIPGMEIPDIYISMVKELGKMGY